MDQTLWAKFPIVTVSIAFVLAFVIPIILVVIRNNVREQRGLVVAEFEKVFAMTNVENASFEFVKNKYHGPDNFSTWKLYLAAIPFVLISFCGITLAFIPLQETALKKSFTLHHLVAPNLLTNGGLANESTQHFETFLTVCIIAFAASFLFALRYLVRSIANFDLAPLTFFWVTLHMLLAIVTAGALWRTFPNLGAAFAGADAANSAVPVSLMWIGAAFMIGFFPDLGVNYLVQRIPFPLKRSRDDLLGQCAVTSIEVIDGIDIWKRFRLEEIDISDVQNLATTNPILLHVETPYGFYECFDWVAQAQLCTIVGADQYLELRRRHIRTVFDLERAVLGPQSTEPARRMIADILFATGPNTAKFRGQWGGADAGEPNGANPASQPVYDDATCKHLVRCMLDDLHVHRLRQTWIHTARKLGARSMSLDPFYELEDGTGALTGPQPIVVAANGAHKPNGGEPKTSDLQAH
jgi:hypothetical protein